MGKDIMGEIQAKLEARDALTPKRVRKPTPQDQFKPRADPRLLPLSFWMKIWAWVLGLFGKKPKRQIVLDWVYLPKYPRWAHRAERPGNRHEARKALAQLPREQRLRIKEEHKQLRAGQLAEFRATLKRAQGDSPDLELVRRLGAARPDDKYDFQHA